MIGFENFSVSSWIDNCLTHHIAVQKKPSESIKRTIKKSPLLALIIVGSNVFPSSSIASQAATMKIPTSIEQTQYHSKLGDLVPDGYWTKLISKMKSGEKLPEPDIEYPDID